MIFYGLIDVIHVESDNKRSQISGVIFAHTLGFG